MKNSNLHNAKKEKNDEFYTQWADIEKEIMAYIDADKDVFRDKTVLLPCDDPEWSNFTKFFVKNFDVFGLKKLISTSYAYESKKLKIPYQVSLFEQQAPQFNPDITQTNGKIFILDRDKVKNIKKLDIDNLEWDYLKGDGDFRSEEVRKLRDESDVIVTNPPFSLFREFLAWIMEGKKEFSIIGNMNAITYKEVFPLIKGNKIWLGVGFNKGNAYFKPLGSTEYANGVYDDSTGLVKFRNCIWFTNIDHKRRHEPLKMMTMAENIKYSRHKEIRDQGYQKYDNYDAIEVPYSDAIPSDYDGVMGVPISFLDKYCPEQFEVLGITENNESNKTYHIPNQKKYDRPYLNGERMYSRLLIKKR